MCEGGKEHPLLCGIKEASAEEPALTWALRRSGWQGDTVAWRIWRSVSLGYPEHREAEQTRGLDCQKFYSHREESPLINSSGSQV